LKEKLFSKECYLKDNFCPFTKVIFCLLIFQNYRISLRITREILEQFFSNSTYTRVTEIDNFVMNDVVEAQVVGGGGTWGGGAVKLLIKCLSLLKVIKCVTNAVNLIKKIK
jgi:hypothetical protein